MSKSIIMELESMGVGYSKGRCPQFGYRMLWIEKYTPEIFTWNNNHGNGQKLDFIYGLNMWLDTGTEEIKITVDNYRDYDWQDFYMDHKGTYNETQI
jgi:hypothetical protein